MLRSRQDGNRLVRYQGALHSWAFLLRHWWYTLEKDRLLFLAILPLIPALIATATWRSVEMQRGLAEAREQERQLRCLALNIYHEARGEPRAGQYAVAEVTMNRVASPRFPGSVCDVVHERRWDRIRKRYVGAFSWTELRSLSVSDEGAWARATHVAEAVYHEREEPKLDGALFYHSRRIRPSWARKKTRVARIGRHIFYR